MDEQEPRSRDDALDERAARIRAVVFDFLSRKNKGEPVEATKCERAHPELLPELHDALERGLQQLRQFSDSERAHGTENTSVTAPQSYPIQDGGPSRPRPIIRNYRLIREISAGAQGTVFEAIQEVTGRTVAVKVVAWVSRNSAARFEREVQALATLNHPGIVGVIDRGRTADDAYFLVMEYVKGVDLNEWVAARRGVQAGQREVVTIFAKIASAINAAHRQGIIHRDLKPSNVRVDEFDRPRIVDFGLAHLLNENENLLSKHLTMTGNIVGSIPWASPEQAAVSPEKFCAATDVYSLGVLLYESLTGRFPYAVDGLLHVVTKNICERPALDPGKVAGGPFGRIDPALASILLKCLAKNPSDRFGSGGELEAALESYLAGRYRLPRRLPKRWLLIAQGGVVGLIAITAWPLLKTFQHGQTAVVQLLTIKNACDMELVQIPTGAFRMGSAIDDPGRSDCEEPHTVRMTYAYFIAKTEVTRGQYLKVMGALPAGVSAQDLDLPVDQVSFDDATAFCKKLSLLDNRECRLPTEAEWEYACRAGSLGTFAGSGGLDTMGWYKGNSSGKLHKVGLKQPNRWGVYDMHGNVAEWVLDSFIPYLGLDDVSDPFHQVNDGSQAVRGGSAFDVTSACRSASRINEPATAARGGLGFRVVIGPLPHRS